MDHISPTQINMYLRCPASYYYRYVCGMVLPPKSALTKGRAVHKGQEHNYRQKIESYQDLPLHEVKEVTAAAFEAEQDLTEFEPDEKPGQVKDEAVTLAALYHQEVAPKTQPFLVEEKVEVPLAGTTLLGFIDLLDNRGYIHDTKTASRTPSEDSAAKNLQLSAYSLAHRYLMGIPEAGVRLDYLVQARNPKVVTLEAKRTERDIQRFTAIAERVVAAINAGVFYPNPDNFLCSEKHCGYWKICHQDF